ncbi:MAG: DUF1598 domain-containing protein [Planctomycetaceae bacterium]
MEHREKLNQSAPLDRIVAQTNADRLVARHSSNRHRWGQPVRHIALSFGRLAVAICFLLGITAREGAAQFNGGGIAIDAEGVVTSFVPNESPRVRERRMRAFAEEQLSEDLRVSTPLRKVSLKQLEMQIQAAINAKMPLSDDVKSIYGLQRIDYIFVDAEKLDVLIAGPAEAFAPNAEGRMVGLTTGRPTLRLDDFIVALRGIYLRREMMSVSIDPEPKRLAEMQAYLANNSVVNSKAESLERFQTLARILGLQNITLTGVPENSHFAINLVEADYRMKRMAMGVDKSPVPRIKSHLAHAKPGGDSLQRWWFIPLYDPIETDAAELTFRLSGQRCQLLAQQEWVDAAGRRSDATTTRASTEKFAEDFTKYFDDLAKEAPVFATLQNEFDLAVLAAILKSQRIPQRIDWKMDLLLNSNDIPMEAFPTPKFVPSVAMGKVTARTAVGAVGGVTLNPMDVVEKGFGRTQSAALEAVRAKATSNPSNRLGWWD